MTVAMDFGVLPPEVNSGLMYAGAGSGPLVAAASAWTGLASELGSAANACVAVLSELTSGSWQGPSAASMAAAAAPYAGWMQATAGHAARAASAAAAAVDAYEAAFAATVAPAAVAANRVQLASLVSTNVFGQNTAAIAATETAYAEMWAQDAAAMYSYAGASATAATLDPLHEPPVTTTADGSAHQTAAAAQATSSAAANTPTSLSQLLSTLQTSLQGLTAPGTGGQGILSTANASSTTGLSGLLNLLSGQTNSSLGDLLNAYFGNSIFSSGVTNPTGVFNVFNAFDYLLIYAAQDSVASHAFGGNGLGPLGPIVSQISSVAPAPAPAGFGAPTGMPMGAAAGVGKAGLVGALSVPHSWPAGAPAVPTGPVGTALGPSAAPPGLGVGPTALPGAPMPGAVRGKGRYARRYGFRPAVITRTPAGG